jgi:multidrug resistance efflux pump
LRLRRQTISRIDVKDGNMRRKSRITIALAVAAVGIAIGIGLYLQGLRYVTTDNASIGAPLISVSSLSAGQIVSVNVGIGDRVEQKDAVAEIASPHFSDGGSLQGFRAVSGSGAPVEAPVSGYVAAVWTYPGAVVGAGSPIVTLFDDSSIWVTANVNENKIRDIRPGQIVDVTVDCLGGAVLRGKVEGIARATASSFSLLPSGSSSANFTKVAQVVPVRISLDSTDGLMLIPGSSVEVKIHIR